MEANNPKHEAWLKKALQSQLEVHPEYQGLSIENQTILMKLQYEIDKATRYSNIKGWNLMDATRAVEAAKAEAEEAKYQIERAQKELESTQRKFLGKV